MSFALLWNFRTALILISAVSTFFTVLTFGNGTANRYRLQRRMRAVRDERERIRRQLSQEARGAPHIALTSGLTLRVLIDRLNLFRLVEEIQSRVMLRQAGYRTQRHVLIFVVARLATPFALFVLAYGFFWLINDFGFGNLLKFVIASGMFAVGFYAPVLYLRNRIQKRQYEIRKHFPDALDLLLICIEVGQSVEVAFNRIATELASDAPVLSEEFTVTTAELSYLQDRRRAFENMGERIGLSHVRTICSGLIQSEAYGTSLSQVLRTMAQESRTDRLLAAEKKAAALPPKLTVPMVIFFLPGLFVVVLGPALISVLDNVTF